MDETPKRFDRIVAILIQLQSKKIVKVGLQPDSQRYFDHHHASNDTFDAVNKRELELGAAAMASLLYLVDQNGIVTQ